MSYLRFKHKRTWHWIGGTRTNNLNRLVLVTACGLSEGDNNLSQQGATNLDRLHQSYRFCTECAAKVDEVYDILVAHCGAYDSPDRRAEFAAQFPDCVEFRFQGDVGFGGKVWWSRYKLYVTCYPEDRTDKRDAMIAAANAALERLLEQPEVNA